MATTISSLVFGPILAKLSLIDSNVRGVSDNVARYNRDSGLLDRVTRIEQKIDGMDTAVESLTDVLAAFETPEIEVDFSGVEYTVDNIESTVNDIESKLEDLDFPDVSDLTSKLDDIETHTSYVYDHIDNVYSKVDDVESTVNDIQYSIRVFESALDNANEKLDIMGGRIRNVEATVNDILFTLTKLDEFLREQGGVTIDVNVRRNAEMQ